MCAHGLPDPGRRHRGHLPGGRRTIAPGTSAACATTTRRFAIEWPLPVERDLREGPGLAAVGGVGERPELTSWTTALRARARGGQIRCAWRWSAPGSWAAAIANQIVNSVPGMELAAISNRHAERGLRAYPRPARQDVTVVATAPRSWRPPSREGRHAVTEDPPLVCRAEGVDAVLEVTGAVGLRGASRTRRDRARKARGGDERRARRDAGPAAEGCAPIAAGVVYSASDGDQPGVQMNLLPLRQRRRRDAAAVRQHQGAARPVAQPRRPRQASPAAGDRTPHGHELRRRDEDLVRAGDGGQRAPA